MKGKLFYILSVFILSYNISFGQDKIQEVKKSDWSNIISYVAAKITDLYIQEYLGKQPKGSKKAVEEDSYLEFKEELANNTIGHPINPDTLQIFLQAQFRVTNEKLTAKILAWHTMSPRNMNTMFDSLSQLLVDRKSEIQNNPEFNVLKTEVRNRYDLENGEEKDLEEFEKEAEPENPEQAGLWNSLWIFQALTGVFFFTSTILLIFVIYFRNRLQEEKDIPKKGQEVMGQSDPNPNQTNSTHNRHTSKKTIQKAEEIKISADDFSNEGTKTTERKKASTEPTRESEIISPIPTSNKETFLQTTTNEESKPKVFYAGKPTPQREFQDMKDNKEDNHIYKLTVRDEINAEFELVDLSSYMKTEVVNSPDEYLYRVCHHENNNTEFTSDILTIKKGTANKIDGMWYVNEDNKAIIKFQ